MERLGCSRGTGTKAESGCNSVLCTRNMDNITGKLRDVSQVMLLLGRPRQRETEKRVCQRLMFSEQGELPPFQKETEVSNNRVSSQEPPGEGEILRLDREQFLGKES